MLQRKRNRWQLYPHKVRYTNSKSEDENNVTIYSLPDKEWWTTIANKHDHITVHEFIDVAITEEMQQRFKEIEYMPEDFFDIYVEYVLTGNTSEDIELSTNHQFNILRLRKKEADHTDYLIDIDFRLSLTELGL